MQGSKKKFAKALDTAFKVCTIEKGAASCGTKSKLSTYFLEKLLTACKRKMATNNTMTNANSLVSRHNGAMVASALRAERASISLADSRFTGIDCGSRHGIRFWYQPESQGLRVGDGMV